MAKASHFTHHVHIQEISGDQLRQGRHTAGLGPFFEGAPGGGVHYPGVGRHAPVEGVLDAAVRPVATVGRKPRADG